MTRCKQNAANNIVGSSIWQGHVFVRIIRQPAVRSGSRYILCHYITQSQCSQDSAASPWIATKTSNKLNWVPLHHTTSNIHTMWAFQMNESNVHWINWPIKCTWSHIIIYTMLQWPKLFCMRSLSSYYHHLTRLCATLRPFITRTPEMKFAIE